jgi:hypothetical protein
LAKKIKQDIVLIMEIDALSKVNRIRKLQRAAPIGKSSVPLTEAEKVAQWTKQVKEMPEIRPEVVGKESAPTLMDLAAKMAKTIVL